mmetsp:Transcript_2266/g.6783  ORF Transcript_2266/g.6783 Transcript_2266/m.6783 type:complete len:205 (+) Transcript_2266:458-1072(+)
MSLCSTIASKAYSLSSLAASTPSGNAVSISGNATSSKDTNFVESINRYWEAPWWSSCSTMFIDLIMSSTPVPTLLSSKVCLAFGSAWVGSSVTASMPRRKKWACGPDAPPANRFAHVINALDRSEYVERGRGGALDSKPLSVCTSWGKAVAARWKKSRFGSSPSKPCAFSVKAPYGSASGRFIRTAPRNNPPRSNNKSSSSPLW